MATPVEHDEVEAWYINNNMDDHRLPNHHEPQKFVSLDQLKELGVLMWRLTSLDDEVNEELEKFCMAKGYSKKFVLDVCPKKLPNYEFNVKRFFEEHLHEEEETHYIVEGSGYFDVRDKSDTWLRIATKKGCILALPAGIYHRFSLDTTNYIKVIRLFSTGGPLLTIYGRPSDNIPARKEYVEALMKKGVDCTAVEAL